MPYCSDLIKRYRQAASEHKKKDFYAKLKNEIIAVQDAEKPLLHYVIEDCGTEDGWCYAVKLLLKAGADVNSVYDDCTPLHLALNAGKLLVIRLLVATGADVNRESDEYVPILHIAVAKANRKEHERQYCVDAVKILLAAGAHVNQKNCVEKTPLHAALINGDDIDIIDLLLAYDADVNSKYKADVPLGLAIKNTKMSSKDRLHAVKSLLAAGARVNQKNGVDKAFLHRPPLHVALTQGGDIDIINLLVLKHADINSKYNDETPLKPAIKNLSSIVEKSSKRNSLEELNAIRIIELLVTNGADMSIKMRHQEIWRELRVSGAERVVSIYKQSRKKHDYELTEVVGGAYANLVRSLIRYGADVTDTMKSMLPGGFFSNLFNACDKVRWAYARDDALEPLHINEKMIRVDRLIYMKREGTAKSYFCSLPREQRKKIIKRVVEPYVLEQIKHRANFSRVNKRSNGIVKGKVGDGRTAIHGDNFSNKNKNQKNSSSVTKAEHGVGFSDLPDVLLIPIVNFIFQPGDMREARRRYNVMRQLLKWDLDNLCPYRYNQHESESMPIQDCFPQAPVLGLRQV